MQELRLSESLPERINEIRQLSGQDRRIFTNPDVKAWCARRWRYLFLNEAIKDPVALDHATRPIWDRRSPRQKIAEFYLVGAASAAWRDEQPEAATPRVERCTLIVCPGLLNGLLPVRDFQEELPRIEKRFNMRVLRADAHPVRGCEANAADLLAAINEGKGLDAAGREILRAHPVPPDEVFLIGYSKGAPDILTLLARHSDVRSRVRCIFTWAGAVGGSEVADKEAEGFKHSRRKQDVLAFAGIAKGLGPAGIKLGKQTIRRVSEFDTAGAVRDLTTVVRQQFLATHSAALDAMNLPMFYFSGATNLSEVPWSQRSGFQLLAKVDPLNDMQVTSKNAALPFDMATDLGVLRGHHWDLAYPSFNKRRWLNNTFHPFPKEAALAAMVVFAAELGLIN